MGGGCPSLVVQWLRICLATQGIPVWSLVQETIQPALWSLGFTTADAQTPRACALQWEKPPPGERSPTRHSQRKSVRSSEDPAEPKQPDLKKKKLDKIKIQERNHISFPVTSSYTWGLHSPPTPWGPPFLPDLTPGWRTRSTPRLPRLATHRHGSCLSTFAPATHAAWNAFPSHSGTVASVS